jgi:O-acetylhomoserine (thiol)-lyase
MSAASSFRPDTIALHAGQERPDPTTGARAVPIYATTSYVFDGPEHAADLFGLRAFGNIYTRIMNPTTDVFEKRIAALEGGVAAVATASGQAALTLAILNLAQAGDNIVASRTLYGGSVALLATPCHVLVSPRASWTFTTPTPCATRSTITRAPCSWKRLATRRSTCPICAHSPTSRTHTACRCVVDNTFATPILAQPIAHGADIVVHSATKWIGGHGTSIGGVVVDGGRFDWANGTAIPRAVRGAGARVSWPRVRHRVPRYRRRQRVVRRAAAHRAAA